MEFRDSQIILGSERELNLHHHELILNENYHSREGDSCYGCGLMLHSSSAVYHCISFSKRSAHRRASIYNCARFFLHKSCAHLPKHINLPSHEHALHRGTECFARRPCSICGSKLGTIYYFCYFCDIYKICLICVIPLDKINIYPAYHSHKLTLSTRKATFQCDVCNKVDTDFSYMCYKCPFWIHLRCSNLPNLLQRQSHHKHPLTLAYSLPEMYRKFPQVCKICNDELYHSHWLYYCANCRFFAHIKCATSPSMFSDKDEVEFDESKLVNLPAPDHESLLQQCIKKKIIYWLEDAPATPPVHINHWSHEHHQMVLKHRSGLSTTDDDDGLLICNGCTKSISTGDDCDDVFYECSECEYILHRYCALFPKEMQLDREEGKLVGIQPSVHDIWSCTRCNGFRNGTQMETTYDHPDKRTKTKIVVKLDIECALLPKLITHDVHPHLLTQGHVDFSIRKCFACHKTLERSDIVFKCVTDDFQHGNCGFYMHIKCALKPLRVTHRWDRHPLHLIFSPEEIIDHPHEFNCEFCSEEIDTNCWFYHCSVCDLSFHLEECIDLFPYSRVKFGATDIKIQDHRHSLTFVLNKKHQPCQRCHKDTFGKPVLECKPCKFIQHAQPDLCSRVRRPRPTSRAPRH